MKGQRYRDVIVAPNTNMAAALEAGDAKKAGAIYDECERDLAKREGRLSYCNHKGTMLVTATGARSIFDDVDK